MKQRLLNRQMDAFKLFRMPGDCVINYQFGPCCRDVKIKRAKSLPKEETIVQIVGIGPVETVQVGSAGAPSGYWPKPK
jgi:hypothetical protein